MGYSAWAKRRKTLYATGLLVILLAVLIPVILLWIHEPATCFDGKQNQGETAPDMGGPCKRLDPRFVEPVKILWVRPLRLRAGYYNAVAYIENPNTYAGAKQVSYKMSLFDKDGVLVKTVAGKTDIYPSTVFPVFNGGINTGERDVTQARFDFLTSPAWERVDKLPMTGLKVQTQNLTKTRHAIRLTARIKNTTIDDKADIYFVATLFDKNGTAIATSRTYVPYIRANKSKEITFTWPNTLSNQPASVDIVPIMPIE